MKQIAPAFILALIATPASAQFYNPFAVPQRDLMQEQRDAINSGRYGLTYEQQQRATGNQNNPYRGGISPMNPNIYPYQGSNTLDLRNTRRGF